MKDVHAPIGLGACAPTAKGGGFPGAFLAPFGAFNGAFPKRGCACETCETCESCQVRSELGDERVPCWISFSLVRVLTRSDGQGAET